LQRVASGYFLTPAAVNIYVEGLPGFLMVMHWLRENSEVVEPA
jgi:hypothetical protein